MAGDIINSCRVYSAVRYNLASDNLSNLHGSLTVEV